MAFLKPYLIHPPLEIGILETHVTGLLCLADVLLSYLMGAHEAYD